MDRRCYSCASKFSVFKKELGCKSCGHSHCSGCLGFTAVLPQYGNTNQKICKRCHDKITSGGTPKNNGGKWSPPENYKKRIAAFEAKQNQVPGPCQAKPDARYQGLLPEDRVIAERLDRLRHETKPKAVCSTADIESRVEALRKDSQRPMPSMQEIEERLATLQGRNPPSNAPRPTHKPPDTRSQTQKADDLLNQLKEEVAIDHTWDPAVQLPELGPQPMNDLSRVDGKDCWTASNSDLNPAQLEEEKSKLLGEAAAELREENTRAEKILDIAKRLAMLQGKDPEKVTIDDYKLPDSDEETEEEDIQRILMQLSEEAILDEASGFNILPTQSRGTEKSNTQAVNKPPPGMPSSSKTPTATSSRVEDSDEEELPWCCICNEDAALRCHGCDDDLYCDRCFRDGHDKFDQKEHRTSSYRPPPKKRGR
ncbi:abscission/NoCut checkpoint regulator isoform 2-T2 [Pelodytes ibericus]